MTGIERLRELGGAVSRGVRLYDVTSRDYDEREGLSVKHDGGLLSEIVEDIADQIERERDEAYDVVLPENREAIAWVKEHGGIAYVRDAWNVRSNLDRQLEKAQAKVERQQRHIELVQRKCRERRERIEELSRELDELDDICGGESVKDTLYEALNLCATIGCEPSLAVGEELIWALGECTDIVSKRLMPEGMEWPRFEDGEAVKFGDMALIDGVADMVEAVQLWIHGKPVIYGDGGSQQLERGERVKRPTPKVPAFDGKPLRVGETVWDKDSGDRLIVGAIEDGGHTVTCRYADLGDSAIPTHGSWSPCNLTHERPDSWERLEEDVSNASCPDVYCANRRIDASDTSYEWAMARDIVRRAKELAERDR